METVISKRSFIKFYINLLGFIGISILFTLLILFKFYKVYQEQQTIESKYYFLLIIVVAIIGFNGYYITEYFKKAPSITIRPDRILFGKTSFEISNIDHIKFTGKKDFIFYGLECTMIVFKNNTAKLIFDDMYSNAPELKSYLDKLVNNKPPHKVQDTVNESGLSFQYYKGYFLLNFRMLSLEAFLAFAIYLTNKSAAAIILIIMLCFFIYLISDTFNYFGLNDDYIVIRNHLRFWKKKIYSKNDIELVIFEFPQSRNPNSIKIILKDYTSKKYYVAGLNDKTLRNLKTEFKKLNTNVRNDLHI